ncbi:MAG TPA: hypothetical protein PKI97_06770 [Smithellaceae bacterium]|nr:hypothetical protein [Smithellaceae bacterium]
MLKLLGVVINLGLVIYLGLQLSKCMGPEEIAGLNTAQNPMIISFVAVIALFVALKN